MKTYPTLEALVQENPLAVLDPKQHAYKITTPDGPSVYVLAKSQGAAALTVCEVETCNQRDIKIAMSDALRNRGKEKA